MFFSLNLAATACRRAHELLCLINLWAAALPKKPFLFDHRRNCHNFYNQQRHSQESNPHGAQVGEAVNFVFIQ